MKKMFVLLLAVVLLVTGCSSGTDTGSDASSTDSNATSTEASDSPTAASAVTEAEVEDSNIVYNGNWGERIVEDDVEIKIHAYHDVDAIAKTDSLFSERYAELTGVKIIGTANGNAERLTDLNLHAVDGFPSDIISTSKDVAELHRYAAEGAFYDLNDYLYMMPNLQAFLETDLGKQAYEATLTTDGEFFVLPQVERFKVTHIPLIRKDWLDELELQVPQTVDELHDALLAFKDNDLGEGLTIPFLAKTWVLQQNVPALFGARIYTRATNRMVNDEDGTFTHGWATDDFRSYVTQISQWYDEGLLAQDVFTASNPLDVHFPADQGGFTYWSASKIGFNTQDNMPEGFELVPMLPTEYNEAGDRLDIRATHYLRKGGLAISRASDNPELAAAVIDSLLSRDAQLTMKYGFMDEHIEYIETVDGLDIYANTQEWQDTIDSDFDGNEKTARHQEGFIEMGISLDPYYDTYRVVSAGQTYEKTVVEEIEEMYLEAFDDGTVTFIPGETVTFSSEDTIEANTIYNTLKTYQDEVFQKAIMNDASELTDEWWQAYLQSCNDLDMERLVEIYNK